MPLTVYEEPPYGHVVLCLYIACHGSGMHAHSLTAMAASRASIRSVWFCTRSRFMFALHLCTCPEDLVHLSRGQS